MDFGTNECHKSATGNSTQLLSPCPLMFLMPFCPHGANQVRHSPEILTLKMDNGGDAKMNGRTEPVSSAEGTKISDITENYENYSKEHLIDKIRKLTCHVKQLQNVIRRDADLNQSDRIVKKAKRDRPFDFSRHPKRHVALKVAYLGWDYQGLAVQEDTDRTIEAYLFDALTKAKLIESRSTSNYHRCGRTDKGVSAFNQVISIDLRSKCTEGLGVITSHIPTEAGPIPKVTDLTQEIDYCKILNAMLPKEIRILAWAPVRPDFSARFDCKERVYRYFIPAGNANLVAMQQAGEYLIGSHDYQNFCKIDTSAEKSTLRSISSVKITPCSSSSTLSQDPYQIFQLEIRGQSFLWHQIRCIVAVLILVGQGQEKPAIVRDLLDLTLHPRKPQYSMAMDYPLVLFDTDHGDEIKEWIYSPDNLHHTMATLQSIWSDHSLKSQMVLAMIQTLQSLTTEATSQTTNPKVTFVPEKPVEIPNHQLSCLLMGTKTKVYRSLADRPVCARTSISNTNVTTG